MRKYFVSDCRVLMDDVPLFEAKNAREAVMKMFQYKEQTHQIKLDKKGEISAVPVEQAYPNAVKVKKGRYVWFKIVK